MSVLALVFLCLSCGKQANPHLKRGDDWIKLQDYTQAASEFRQAVADEPANAEAHVGLIKSLIGLGRYGDAIKEIDVVGKLDPNPSRATDLTRMVEDSIVKATEKFVSTPRDSSRMTLMDSAVFESQVDNLFNNLALLRKVGSVQSLPLLKSLMGGPATRMASLAESVLLDLSPSDVPSTLDALLSSSNAEVKMRTAKRLWKGSKNDKAGRILLDTTETQMTTAGKVTESGLSDQSKNVIEVGLQDLEDLGYDLAKTFYQKVISTSQLYNWELTTACVKKVNAARDAEMKEVVIEMLKSRTSDPKKIIGFSPTQEGLDYLANIGDKTFLPEVKAALGYYFPSGDQSLCPSAISLLSKMDGKKWDSFSYWYSGWPEFRKLNLDINRKRGDFGGSGQPVVDNYPEDDVSINRLFAGLGPMSGLSGGAREISVSRVEVIEADRIKWVCIFKETRSGKVIGEGELIFRGTGNKERAWVLTKVENLRDR